MSVELQKTVQGYENYISQNGIDAQAIDAYVEACNFAIKKKKIFPMA